MRVAKRILIGVVMSWCACGFALAAPLGGDANDDGIVDLEDFVILKTHFGMTAGATAAEGDFDGDGDVDLADFMILKGNFGKTEPTGGRPVLTVVETEGDYYTITAHDSVDPAIGYWEILVDVAAGGIFSFVDLTDAGDGAGGHSSYLGANAYNRKTTLVRFSGRGGDVLSRMDPVADLADKLTFTTEPGGRSFTITYAETPALSGYYHGGYEDGERSLIAGELLTTVSLVIRPPGYDGTAWDWSIGYENVSTHDLSAKIWAVDYRELWLYGGLAMTSDSDTTKVDGLWDPAAAVSYARWTTGDNSGLGLTTGRQFVMDRQTGVEGYAYGGGVSTGAWAGFDHIRYGAGYGLTAGEALAPGAVRTETGQVIIDIAGEGASEPPVADAGPDQTAIDANNTGAEDVTLDGSGSYDPDGTIDTYAWEEFAAVLATGVSPTVSLAPGVHTIELVVTDDAGDIGVDTVVVTVNAYLNLAPTVEAGPNLAIAPGVTNLYGRADDDGLPLTGALATTWTAAGPAPVVFGDAGAPETIAVFTADGVYTVQLEARDGEWVTTDTLTVTVDSAATPPTLRNSISQYGVTWTFDRYYQTGQFANGDYWVVGPVTLIEIDPRSEELIGTTSLAGFTLGGADPRPRTMNGSMLDPVTPPGGGRLRASTPTCTGGIRRPGECTAVSTTRR